MKKLLLIVTVISINSISFSQYCISGGPTTLEDSNIESFTLNGASGSINFTGCPSTTGVQEFLGQTAFLNAGGNYTANIQFGTCLGNYSGVGEAWIDYNQNYIFEPSESIGTWSGLPPVSMSAFNFTVPGGAVTGQSRLRVMQYEGGSFPLDPCSSFPWGSVTDFSVFIQNGIDCSGYIGDNISDPRLVNTFPFIETHNSSLCYTNQNNVYNSPDVFYRIIPNSSFSSIDVSLCGSTFDTFLTILDENGTALAINDDYQPCGSQSKISVSTVGHNALYAIVEGWGIASGDYTITIGEGTLNINEVQIDEIDISPNPSLNEIKIISPENSSFQIINTNGKIIQVGTFSRGVNIENISKLEPGIYFLQTNFSNKVSSKKIIKL